MSNALLGYFDAINSAPAFDPGLRVNCLVCVNLLGHPMKTISLTSKREPRSYFFRVHKRCWETLSDDERWRIESSIVDGAR